MDAPATQRRDFIVVGASAGGVAIVLDITGR
jgi:hypothetical protein